MANVNANINVNIQTQQAAAQLRKLSADVSRFNQQTFAANSAAAQQQRAINQALVDGVRASGHFRTSIVPMTSAVDKFSTAIEKGQLTLGQYTRYAASQLPGMRRVLTREFDMINRVAEQRVKTLNTQFIALGESANGMQRALAMTPTSLDQFAARSAIALQRQQVFNRLLRDGSTQLLNWGKNTQWAGRQLMVGFTIPLGLLGAQAAKVFRELEAETINFKKVYGDLFTTDVEVEKNLEAIKELSVEMTKYGQTVQQTMQIANTAAASGARSAELLAATRQATRLAVLGQMEQNQAIETTISLQTAFALSNEQLAESINFLNSVENQTILSLQDVSEAIPRVAAVIKGFGGDVGDLAVLLVAMKEGGVSAAEGANALKNSMARIIAPTKQALDVSAKYGISLREIVSRNEGKVIPLFQELAQVLEEIGGQPRQEILSAIFGKFQYARIGTLLSNIAKDGSQAAKAIELTGVEARDLAVTAEKELSTVEEAISTKFTAALEKAKLALAPIGGEFLKALTPVLNAVGTILDKFNELPGGIKTAIVAATGIIGGIAPIVLMVVGLVANGIANIGKFILFLRKQIATLRGNGEQFKMYTSAELEAAAAAASLEGKTSSLTRTMLLQKPAIESLITLYQRLAASAAGAAAAMPATMGGVGVPVVSPRGGGFAAVAPKLPVAYRNAGGPIFESGRGKTRVPGVGNTDTVPAMLTPGEFVINKKATQQNLPLIKAINDGAIGGSQSSAVPRSAEGIQYANLGILMQGLRRIGGSLRPTTPSGKVFPKWFYDTSTGTNTTRQRMALEDSYQMGLRPKKPNGTEYSFDEIKSMNNNEISKIWRGVQKGHMAPSISISEKTDFLPGIMGPMLGGGKGGNISMIRGGNPKEIYDMFSSLEAKGIHPMSIMFGAAKELGYATNPALFIRTYNEIMQGLLFRRTNFGTGQTFETWAYRIIKRNLGSLNNKDGNFIERMSSIGTVRGIDPMRSMQDGQYKSGRGSLYAAMASGFFNKGGMIPGIPGYMAGARINPLFKQMERRRASVAVAKGKSIDDIIFARGSDKKLNASAFDLLTLLKHNPNLSAKELERIQKYHGKRIRDGVFGRFDSQFGVRFKDSDSPVWRDIAKILDERGFPVIQKRNMGGGITSDGAQSKLFMANNGNIVPGMGSTDTVPAMLTPGEFVVNKKASQSNMELLDAINSGKINKYRFGGMVAKKVSDLRTYLGMRHGATSQRKWTDPLNTSEVRSGAIHGPGIYQSNEPGRAREYAGLADLRLPINKDMGFVYRNPRSPQSILKFLKGKGYLSLDDVKAMGLGQTASDYKKLRERGYQGVLIPQKGGETWALDFTSNKMVLANSINPFGIKQTLRDRKQLKDYNKSQRSKRKFEKKLAAKQNDDGFTLANKGGIIPGIQHLRLGGAILGSMRMPKPITNPNQQRAIESQLTNWLDMKMRQTNVRELGKLLGTRQKETELFRGIRMRPSDSGFENRFPKETQDALYRFAKTGNPEEIAGLIGRPVAISPRSFSTSEKVAQTFAGEPISVGNVQKDRAPLILKIKNEEGVFGFKPTARIGEAKQSSKFVKEKKFYSRGRQNEKEIVPVGDPRLSNRRDAVVGRWGFDGKNIFIDTGASLSRREISRATQELDTFTASRFTPTQQIVQANKNLQKLENIFYRAKRNPSRTSSKELGDLGSQLLSQSNLRFSAGTRKDKRLADSISKRTAKMLDEVSVMYNRAKSVGLNRGGITPEVAPAISSPLVKEWAQRRSRTMMAGLSKQTDVLMANAGTQVPGVGNTDTVPAMLTPGEFVVNKEATQKNLPLIQAINDGQTQFLSEGAPVTQAGKKSSSGSSPFKSGIPAEIKELRRIGQNQLADKLEMQYRRTVEAMRIAGVSGDIDRAHTVKVDKSAYRPPTGMSPREAQIKDPNAPFHASKYSVQSALENRSISNQIAQNPATLKEMQTRVTSYFDDLIKKVDDKDPKRDLKKASLEKKRDRLNQKLNDNIALNNKELKIQRQLLSKPVVGIAEQDRLNAIKLADAREQIKNVTLKELRQMQGPIGQLRAPTPTLEGRGRAALAASGLTAQEARQQRKLQEVRYRQAVKDWNAGGRVGPKPTKSGIPVKTPSAVSNKEARRQAVSESKERRAAKAGGSGGDGNKTTGTPGAADPNDPKSTPRQSRMSRINNRLGSGIGKAGMGLGMGVSMMGMVPMMAADKETGKWMGMDPTGAMMGMMGAGTLLSLLPMIPKAAAAPVAGVAAAAALVGFGLYKWRDGIDNAARKTAEFGSNLGVAANSVGNMATILGKQDLLDTRKYQQLTVLPGQEEEFASYTEMLTQEGSVGAKFIKELRTATSEERFSKLADYLRGAIAAGLLTIEESQLFSKAVGAQIGDPILAIRASAEVSRQKTGASALMDIAQERVDAAIEQSEIKKTIRSTEKDSLDASEASMTVGAGTQIIKSFNEAIAKAQLDYQNGIIKFSELVEIVDSANSSIGVWENNIKKAYENVNDFGGILQGTKTALALAGVSPEQQKAMDQAYKQVFQGIGSTITAGAQRGKIQRDSFITAEGEKLASLETEGAFQKVADLAEKAGFDRNIQGVGAYTKSEDFDRQAFDDIVEYGKNVATLMDNNMLKAAMNLAVAERGIDPAEAVSMMNTIVQNETALQAFLDGGQTVDAFMNSIVAANAELMFSSEKLKESFNTLSGQLDKTGQSEALRAYVATGATEGERAARLREIERVGAGMSERSALNARAVYLDTKTIAGQYYDPRTIASIQGSAAYQSAMTRTRAVTRTGTFSDAADRRTGMPAREISYQTQEFDDSAAVAINNAIRQAGEAGVSGNVLTYALKLSVEEGTDAGRKIDIFTEKVKDLQGLDEQVRISLNIDLNKGEDVATFGGFANDILRSWGMLSALNPNIDFNLVARAVILDDKGNVITDPALVAKNIMDVNKAYSDLEKAGGGEQKKKAQRKLVEQYQVETEIVDSEGNVQQINPEDIVNAANKTLKDIGKNLDNLPAVKASQILQIQTSLSDATAEKRAEYYKLQADEKAAIDKGDFETARRIAQRMGNITSEISELEKNAQANILGIAIGGGGGDGGGGGGGGSQSPLKGFVDNILNQFKMWVDASAKMTDLNNARSNFINNVLKGDSLFKKLDKVKGIDPARLQEILGMGPEGAKEFLDKYTKDGSLTKAGRGILDSAIQAGIGQTIGTNILSAKQERQQASAADFLNRRGEGSQVIQSIAGDPGKAAELLRLRKEYNQAVKGGNKEDIEKADKALNRYINSERRLIKAGKEREEAMKSASEKAIEANEDTIEANNKYMEEGDKHFEREQRNIEKNYRDRIKSAEDQIDSLNDQIDVVNKLIEEQEKLNNSDQNRIRGLERQKEMLNRQLETLDRANELDERRIQALQRDDEIRSKVSDALERDLELMSREEEKIRDAYDKRIEALDEVARLNDYITNQQRQQIDLSKAISEGDVYAAIQAAQQMRASSAQFATEQVRSGLQQGMENQIAGLRTSGGLTREQAELQIQGIQDQSYQTSLQIRDIEDAIYNRNLQMIPIKDQIRNIDLQVRDIQDQIYNRETIILGIQNERLAPLQTALRDQQEILDKLNKQVETEIEAIKFRGMSAEQWADTKLLLNDQNESLIEQNELLAEEDERLAGLSKKWNKIAKQIAEANRVAKERDTTTKNIAAAEIAAIEANTKLSSTERAEQIRKRNQELIKSLGEIESERKKKTGTLLASGSNLSAFAGGLMKYVAGGLANPMKFTSREAPPVQKRGMGGSIFGNGTRDSIPAILAPGEFVIRKAMVDKYGIPMMESLNQGSFAMPRYNVGEQVGGEVAVVSNNMTSNINAPVYNTYDMKFSINGANQSADEIANKVMFKMKQLQNHQIRGNRGY